MPDSPVLTVRDLTRRVGEKTIVDGFTYDFHAGRLYTVLGPSGAG